MNQELIQINKFATPENTIESFVCFHKFIHFLEDKIKTETSSRAQFYKIVRDNLRLFPELLTGIDIKETQHYKEILDLVSAIVLPLIDNEDETILALTNASSMEVFYATSAFNRVMKKIPFDSGEQTGLNEKSYLELHKDFQYGLILKYIYGYQLPKKNEIIHSFLNPLTGLYQYFRLHADTRFADVKIKPGIAVPAPNLINSCFADSKPAEKIEAVLSLNDFIASGFCIITLTDITAQQAMEQMGKAVIRTDHVNTNDDFSHITRLMQTIVGSNNYRFGMMPFFSINKRAALPYENFTYSIAVKASFDAGISKTVFTRYINHYIKNPQFIIYKSSDTSSTLPVALKAAFDAADIHYYALAPVFFNDALTGIFEIAAGNTVAPLNDLQLTALKPAIPFVSQLLMKVIEKFNIAIDAIIKDKFTNIQPAVQWKFNEVAWHYFRSHDLEHKNKALEKISFKDVYPLYGAVDIRNSTIERNRALREDLAYQLELLNGFLTELYKNGHNEKEPSLALKCNSWIEKMKADVSMEEELELKTFLNTTIHPLLKAAERNGPEQFSQDIKFYFNSINETTGGAYSKRRQLENTMRTLNTAVSQYFDLSGTKLQKNYPCYFEKFRTDGTEYNIYIGQSIAPSIPFSFEHIEWLRMWQVQSMAAIAKLTHSLLPQLEAPLHTTQLIFVNPNTIEISFRNDERRFDTEGAYNIRYHIVKKRIDKVQVKDTGQRLTQPGKIAIVYFNEKDVTAYISNINQLQKEQILLNDLERLELEELQGVAGLKALRVGVRLEIN